ncbi:AbrB family transcriptional regulator [Maritalea mobilis]|uniref:AbrB family transcriptional regulator n=1 Tax=Maritalea mobilis TaxID=483324 RepID=UPI001C97A573|nr:AbrB family transcriptional regulator [Maritalea mobilis]MBY6202436.1 AbrB family transcriptional regulator [Maritalea mobilis]
MSFPADAWFRAHPVRQQGLTLVLAGIGAVLFWALDFPLPVLFGPLAACLFASLAGAPLKGVRPLSQGMRTILGVAIGASLTPAVIGLLPQMAASVALVPLYIVVIALIGVPFFRKVYKFDAPTSWYAAMPGGLQDMVMFGQEAGADTRALALIHATRMMIVVTIAPIVLTQGFGVSLDNPIGQPASDIPLHELAIMALAAIGGWALAVRIGLFGAPMLGPLIVAGILTLTDVIHHRPPAEAILAAQFFIGITLGAGYIGVTWHEIRRDVVAAVFFVLMLSAVTLGFTELVILTGLAPPVDAFLAFAPAGQAEMTVLAIVVGADLGYVVVHHLTRVFLVIMGAPVAAHLFKIGKAGRDPKDQ